MTLYVCPRCGGQVEAVKGAQLWHPCPKRNGRQVRLEVVQQHMAQQKEHT